MKALVEVGLVIANDIGEGEGKGKRDKTVRRAVLHSAGCRVAARTMDDPSEKKVRF